MKAWFQRSDFSSQDLTVDSIEEACQYLRRLNSEQEDALMQKLIGENQDFCSWGLGLNWSNGSSVHITRSDCAKNLFDVLLSRPARKKILGIFPINTDVETLSTNLSLEEACQKTLNFSQQ